MNALIQNKFNIRQALLIVGLAAKGGNYVRCYRLKREYNKSMGVNGRSIQLEDVRLGA